MLFQNIDFHNVADLTPEDGGWRLWRFPADVRAQLNDRLREEISGFNTGVELRFRMKSNGVTLLLRSLPAAEAQVAHIYYGSFQGGWDKSARVIGGDVTRIHIPAIDNTERLRRLTRESGLPFSPDVVRVLLPYNTCIFLGVEGDVEPPQPEDLPARRYLAYGSSITHGSLALDTPHTYVFRTAQLLKADPINLGCAGTCHAEKAMAEYIVNRKDWDLCTLELGINMLNSFESDDFERRIDAFTAVMAQDPRPVFVTSLYHFNGDQQERGQLYRSIVRKYAEKRLHFIDGLELLHEPEFLSQDMVHPSIEGQEAIARRWAAFIREHLK